MAPRKTSGLRRKKENQLRKVDQRFADRMDEIEGYRRRCIALRIVTRGLACTRPTGPGPFTVLPMGLVLSAAARWPLIRRFGPALTEFMSASEKLISKSRHPRAFTGAANGLKVDIFFRTAFEYFAQGAMTDFMLKKMSFYRATAPANQRQHITRTDYIRLKGGLHHTLCNRLIG